MTRLRAHCCRWLAPLALVAFVATFAGSASALGGDELLLWRGQARANGDTVDFFARGARPGEIVVFVLCDAATDEAANQALLQKPVIADAAGRAFLQMPRPDSIADTGAETFFVRARVDREPAQRLWSNFVLLFDEPALYLLVEGEDASGRVVTFDPRRRAIDEALGVAVDPAAPIVATGRTAIVGRDHSLVPLDGAASTDFGPLEEPIHLAATPDRSAVLALTRELLPGGRALLRLRILDASALGNEVGSVEVLRGSRLVAARLVAPEDARRALLVADSGGLIREVTLGVEPGRGVTFLPLAPDDSEELVDVRVADDWLVAVTRSTRPHGGPEGRLLLLDLRTRADPTDWPLPGRALHFEIATTGDAPVAFLTMADDRILAIRLDDPLRGRSELPLAGADRLARSPLPSRLYVLATLPGVAQVYELDTDTLELTPIQFGPLHGAIEQFDVFGNLDRHWLYVVEQWLGERHRLWCCELDPGSGWPIEQPSPLPLPGRVRRTASR